MKRRRILLLGILFASTVRCYSPTQVEIEVLTDVRCPARPSTWLYQGSAAPIADTQACTVRGDEMTMGTLVLVPSGDRDASVVVNATLTVGGKNPESCAVDPADCAFASRSFSYQPHKSLKLPIKIYQECIGKPRCASGQTCVAGGKCEGDRVDPPPPPPDKDGGTVAPIATCTGPNGDDVVAQLPRPQFMGATTTDLYWVAGVPPTLFRRPKAPSTSSPVAIGTYSTVTTLAWGPQDFWVGHDASSLQDGFYELTRFVGDPNGNIVLGGNPAVTSALAPGIGGRRTLYYGLDPMGIATFPSDGAVIRGDIVAGVMAVTGTELFVEDKSSDRLVVFARSGLIEADGNFTKPAKLVSTGSRVFGTRRADNVIYELKSSGPTVFLSPPAEPLALATDDDFLYWAFKVAAGTTNVRRRDLSQSTGAELVASVDGQQSVLFLAADPPPNGCVYFATAAAADDIVLRVAPKPATTSKAPPSMPGGGGFP